MRSESCVLCIVYCVFIKEVLLLRDFSGNRADMARLIGITGGIGSGKSTIARALQQVGYAVYYTDSEARRIMEQNPCVRSQIELLFGSDIYTRQGLDRQEVARQVFSNPRLLQRLNEVVHPAVRFDLEQWVRQSTKKIVFVESAILFESQMNTLCDAVISVSAPEEVRIQRVCQRDGISRDSVRERIANQMSDEERNKLSDLVVINDGRTPMKNIILQIQNFCRTFAAQ